MKVLCVLEVDEEWLRNVTDTSFGSYNFMDAFSLEMRWMAPSGVKLIGFVPVTDKDAEDIVTSRM